MRVCAGALFSFNLALNDLDEYEGGGTYFRSLEGSGDAAALRSPKVAYPSPSRNPSPSPSTSPSPSPNQAQPSALFTYSAAGGGSIRLHAARPLLEGEAVTITYGEHSAEHFCRYYGFVPEEDPHGSWRLRTATLLWLGLELGLGLGYG